MKDSAQFSSVDSHLPDGWKVKKLGDLCTIQLGKTPHRKTERYWDKDKNTSNCWLSIADMVHGKELFDSKEYVSNLGAENINITPKNTLIVSFKLTLGRVSFAGKDLFTNEAIASLINLSGDINKKYLFYYFTFFDWDKATDGDIKVKGKTLNKAKLKALSIIVPPLLEQQRIVEILDKAFVAIDKAKQNAEKNLRNAKEFFVNHLSEKFENSDWETKSLGQVANHSLGKMLDKNKNKGILKKYLRNQSVRWFEFDLHDLTEMPFLEGEKEKYTAIKGDVLICEGGYPGRAAIWQEKYPIYFQKAIHRVRFHQSVYNKWFLYYLFVSDNLGQLKKYFTGTGIQHFTGASLDKFILPIPPKNVVQTLVSKFDKLSVELNDLEVIYQQKLENLVELKKSILKKAFRGEL